MTKVAGDRFELLVEDEGAGGWVKMALYTALFYVTFGLLELYPSTILRVRDRMTGEEVFTQSWASPGAAGEAMEQLRLDLRQLTPGEFLQRWGRAQ